MIDRKLRTLLDRDVRRVLRENGCTEQTIDDVADEFMAELECDPEVAEWLRAHIHREMQ